MARGGSVLGPHVGILGFLVFRVFRVFMRIDYISCNAWILLPLHANQLDRSCATTTTPATTASTGLGFRI